MSLSRRRLFTLFAAAGAVSTLSLRARPSGFVWKGTALGADAEIHIAGLDEHDAIDVVHLVSQEIGRLEAAFSLYLPYSELSRLNRDGILIGPSHDFRLLLEQSLGFWEKTGGAFNPAIQPIWNALAHHFAANQSSPDPEALREIARRCDPSLVSVGAGHIALGPGMALTFNGIAQGYITDAVARILETKGLCNILIALGETYALPGKTWHVGIEGSETIVDLSHRALAQSAGRGTVFSQDRRWHHLIDPRTGRSANYLRSITVAARSATLADALSTALCVAPPDTHASIMSHFTGVEVYREV